MNLLERVNQIPPVTMRLLAARNGKAIATGDIVSRSGLSKSTVRRISSQKNWDGITFKAAIQFSNGCGFDLQHMKVALRRLRYVEQHGLSRLKHLQPRRHAKFYERAAESNRLRFLRKALTQ